MNQFNPVEPLNLGDKVLDLLMKDVNLQGKIDFMRLWERSQGGKYHVYLGRTLLRVHQAFWKAL